MVDHILLVVLGFSHDGTGALPVALVHGQHDAHLLRLDDGGLRPVHLAANRDCVHCTTEHGKNMLLVYV